jgi:co-chaperonin GroES (HSP10)
MESKIQPKFDNIVGIKIGKLPQKSLHGVNIVGADNDDTALIEVIAIGKTCIETSVGEILLVPLSAIRIIYEGTEYVVCNEKAVYATVIR